MSANNEYSFYYSSQYLASTNSYTTGTFSVSVFRYESYCEIVATVRLWQTYARARYSVSGTASATINGTLYSEAHTTEGYANGVTQVATVHTFKHRVAASDVVTANVSFSITINSGTFKGTRSKYVTGTAKFEYSPTEIKSLTGTKMGDELSIVYHLIPYAETSCKDSIIVKYEFAGASGQVKKITDLYGAEDKTIKWTIPDLSEFCEGSGGGALRIIVDNMLGKTVVATSSKTIYISTPDPTSIDAGPLIVGKQSDIYLGINSQFYTMKLRYIMDTTRTDIASGVQADSYQWTPPKALALRFPTEVSKKITLYCDSYNGTFLVGTTSKEVYLTVEESDETAPIFESCTLESKVPGASTFDGMILQSISDVTVKAVVRSDYSTITGIAMSAFGQTLQSRTGEFTTQANIYAGGHTVTVTATDARGFKKDYTIDVTVIAYSKPRVVPYSDAEEEYTAPICYRSDGQGIASGTGTYMRVLAGKKWSSVYNQSGVEMNKCKLEYRLHKIGNPWPGTYISLLGESSAQSIISKIIANAFPETRSSYEVELVARDTVGGFHSIVLRISSEKVNFSLLCAADGAAFGKTAEFPGIVEIADDMTLWVRGGLRVDGSGWKTLLAAQNSHTWETSIDHGRKSPSGCYYRVENGNHVYVAFNRGFIWNNGESIALNEATIPEAYRPRSPVSNICACANGYARCNVLTDGHITIDMANDHASNSWLDGIVDYFLEEV